MKKNTMMRVASVMLMAVLLTTSAISGTFAKYVTSDSGSDSARVAKFGVVLTVQDATNFAATYATDDDSVHTTVKYGGANSVAAANGIDKLVAPGTKDADGITFSIAGTPEVATKIDIDFEVIDDVFLGAGPYADYTRPKDASGSYPKFELDATYYPVVFKLEQIANAAGTIATPVEIAKGTLTVIKNAIEDYAKNAYYDPNTNLAATFRLTWEWAYGTYGNWTNANDINSAVATIDAADTLLGNIVADPTVYAKNWAGDQLTKGLGDDYDTDISYELTITVTQVD